MPNPAKIFISSAYEPNLKVLREKLKVELKNAGHEPLLFEDNFYPWDDKFMDTCLRKVEESNIFILLLTHRAGNYSEFEKDTPTYQEFHRAFSENKYIIAFLDEDVRLKYEQHIRGPLEHLYERFIEENRYEPDYTIDLVDELLENILSDFQKEQIEDVHKFVWAFIFDVQKRNIWTENLKIADSQECFDKIKAYLSDRLGEGIVYVPQKEKIREHAKLASDFTIFESYVSDMLLHMEDGKIANWSNFLIKALLPFTGGPVYKRRGKATAEAIGHLEPSGAASIYQRDDDVMRLCGTCGDITATEEYSITDETSYVVTSYKQIGVEGERTLDGGYDIAYSHLKGLIYCTVKIGEFVLCLHYNLTGDWYPNKVKDYHESIRYAIMEDTSYITFLADFIGGVKVEYEQKSL